MKQITIYEPNAQGAIIKRVGTSYANAEEVIDGEVVNEGFENADSLFSAFFSFFSGKHAAPKTAQKRREKPYNDNGREYNPTSGNWEYTAEAGGERNPFACDTEIPTDYQGSVPLSDGVNYG